ncbi:MAG: hypothetical protein AAF655_01560 [Bacteroidota bacterium]
MRFLLTICLMGTMHVYAQFLPEVKVPVHAYESMDASHYYLVDFSNLYTDAWHEYPQATFWYKIINMSEEKALISVGKTREILGELSSAYYECLTKEERTAYKDSVRIAHKMDKSEQLYVTYGKRNYYEFSQVVAKIDQAIPFFAKHEVDSWYAQAILLVESPAELRTSPVGAYGPFQLMKSIALEYGITVNSTLDERAEVATSAPVAAKLIKEVCIPHAKNILSKHRIPFKEDDLWFKLFVLHIYHAGAANVRRVVDIISPQKGGAALIQQLWKTSYRRFGNASRNYSQLALACLMKLEFTLARDFRYICRAEPTYAKDLLLH